MLWKRLELGEDEVLQLKRFMEETRDKREYMRALIVLMRTQKPYRQIAKGLNVALSTAYNVVRRYITGGIDGLRNRKRGGRKPRIGEEKEIIVELSLKNPQLFGFVKNNWSLRAFSKFLTEELGIKVSKSHVHRILMEAGVVYKRLKTRVKSRDGGYGEKAREIKSYKRVLKALEKGVILAFEDET